MALGKNAFSEDPFVRFQLHSLRHSLKTPLCWLLIELAAATVLYVSKHAGS